MYNTIICKLSFFKFSNFMTGERISTTKVSKCGHFRWHFLIFFVINHAKNMRDRKNVLFFKSRIRIRDPVLKFWFAGSGSGRKWTGSATLFARNVIVKCLLWRKTIDCPINSAKIFTEKLLLLFNREEDPADILGNRYLIYRIFVNKQTHFVGIW